MARGWFPALIVLTLVIASCRSPSSPTPPSGPFTVRGTLTDFATGTPVSGVRVRLAGDDPASARDTVSDSAGRYAVDLSGTGSPLVLSAWLDEARVGDVTIGSEAWRGDLLAGGAGCVSRYGVVVDADTGRAVAGAAVTVGGTSIISAADGWYRIDLGCPAGGVIGFNTSFAEVTHPQYATLMRVVGRGIARVERLDLALRRRSSAGQ